LVAEPLFLLADSVIVGRLGTVPLAALGIAGGLLATVVSTFVFLAYGTTASVARRLGAGDRAAALRQGLDGLWLAVGLGVPVAVGTVVVRAAHAGGVRLAPDLLGVRGAARAGGPLLVRTIALRAALLVTTYAATSAGPARLAAHQVVSSIWFLLALALDALAI